jgi:GDP-L-fucose synthase
MVFKKGKCQAIRKQLRLRELDANLYGTHDNFDLTSSHVLPAMMRKFHEAKENGNIQ